MSVEVFLRNADRNLKSAQLLIEADLAESACSRAYYAMREAARATLFAIGEERAAHSKSHSGLILQFNLHLVKPGMLPKPLSQRLSRASQRRLVADYEGEALTIKDAQLTFEDAQCFVAAAVEFVRNRK